MKKWIFCGLALMAATACMQEGKMEKQQAPELLSDIAARRAQFVDMKLDAALDVLDAGERERLPAELGDPHGRLGPARPVNPAARTPGRVGHHGICLSLRYQRAVPRRLCGLDRRRVDVAGDSTRRPCPAKPVSSSPGWSLCGGSASRSYRRNLQAVSPSWGGRAPRADKRTVPANRCPGPRCAMEPASISPDTAGWAVSFFLGGLGEKGKT